MFSKVLIANRGEIAVRIIRACKEMGIATVAVYSEADKDALHVALADESYCIGAAAAHDSYLNEERIISAALCSGAQAIHPGYGFLSENPHFSQLCAKNGIVFIGPPADTMERLSDKTTIKSLMSKAGLEVIKGTDVLASIEEAHAAAEKIGYPVMLKARSGGGGRGIRMVPSADELENAYNLAVSEAEAAFGDGSVYMEKFVYPARHIEMQIVADEHGNVVCLGERDCSVQRRHQKLIEESPSPAVSKQQRKELIAKVTAAVKQIGYVGVGTLEFLLDKQGNFWFMEMNIRLQVEHSVTEVLINMDLVKWQIRTAAGVELNFTQDEVRFRGSSIECRINALSTGKLEFLHVAGGPFVRFDTYLVQGVEVSPFYDSLLGKLIVRAGTREEALRKMKAALCELVIGGIETNIAQQLELVSDERFMSGEYDLTFMEGR
ncbi:MAG: acetyl-CoA carboxylase biotin carboxylase subunit [Ruminococcus sp.]|nr:acetyl-CoA carboxylase biotin carboxylase subunit [Ruminococcus sp.]